jgi:hypothetical protein
LARKDFPALVQKGKPHHLYVDVGGVEHTSPSTEVQNPGSRRQKMKSVLMIQERQQWIFREANYGKIEVWDRS